MIEQRGDIWDEFAKGGSWLCVTTNGVIKADGNLVMGRGIALEAAQRYPQLPRFIAKRIAVWGLQVELLPGELIAFPTKYHWGDKSDINLILKSTLQLVDAASRIEGRILLPRPGCGCGGLLWAEVKPLLEKYLISDKFVIFSK